MIEISTHLQSKFPQIQLGILKANLLNTPIEEQLWEEIFAFLTRLRQTETTATIKQHPVILSTREAYKLLGKEPSRYRASAEALRRRVLQGKDLYQINTLVDLINFISLLSGFSIGGYDFQKIKGLIHLDKGAEEEPYLAIGRGNLNIEDLPVLRDEIGAFGSPTSDSERTKISLQTTTTLLVFFNFDANPSMPYYLEQTSRYIQSLLKGTILQESIVTF